MPSTVQRRRKCEHPTRFIETVIDELGPMKDVRRGGKVEAEAQVLKYHLTCTRCGATIPAKEKE